jgi:hypothetical protein
LADEEAEANTRGIFEKFNYRNIGMLEQRHTNFTRQQLSAGRLEVQEHNFTK